MTHTRIRTLLLVSAAGLLGLVNQTQAAPQTTILEVDDCNESGDNCGPRDENDGPGHEQAKGTWFIGTSGNPWVAVAVMSSKNIPNRANGPYQCRYYAWEIDSVAGPTLRVDGKLLTQNVGNRPCNHPDLVYAGGNDVLFMFGTNDANQANVQPYAQILNAETGDPKSGRTNLGDNNGNDGAGTATMLRLGSTLETLALPTEYPKRFVYCYNDNGNNADCTVAQIQAGGAVSVVDRINDVIDPANIPRPFQQQITADGVFAVVAAKGAERPPEDGAYLRVINVANPNAGNEGKLTGQQALMMSNEGARLYANSPEITAGPTVGTFWAMNTTSKQSGDGNKGASTLYAHVIQFTPDYKLQILSTTQAGSYQAHGALCTSSHGPDGVQAGVVVEAAITGSGPGIVTPIYYNEGTMAITEGPQRVTGFASADSGYLANLYGNNPNNQGRDFVSCIGSVPNPGYGLQTGFERETMSFIATATYGKNYENDYKNSMWLALVPAHTPEQVLDPDDPGDPGDPGDPDDPGTPDDPETPETPDDDGSSSGSAGGCAAGSQSGTTAGLFFLLGLFVLAARRRRS